MNTVIRVLDWWRPRRPLGPLEAFQHRCLAACASLGLLVGLYSLVQGLPGGTPAGAIALGSFSAACLGLLVLARAGVPTRVLSWLAIALVGVALSGFSLIGRTTRLDQLFWLVLLPLSARALLVPGDVETGHKATGPAMLIGGLLAVALGIAVVIARAAGLHLDQTRAPPSDLVLATEHVLFVGSVVGLLGLHEINVRRTREELALLRQLVRVCAWCKQIDTETGWVTPEVFIARHQRRELTHGMCPSCHQAAVQAIERRQPPG